MHSLCQQLNLPEKCSVAQQYWMQVKKNTLQPHHWTRCRRTPQLFHSFILPLVQGSIVVKSSRALYYPGKNGAIPCNDGSIRWEWVGMGCSRLTMLKLNIRWDAVPRLHILWLFMLDPLKWNISRSFRESCRRQTATTPLSAIIAEYYIDSELWWQ